MKPEDIAKANTEHAHQAALFCMAAQHYHLFPELKTGMFAVPNGGERNIKVAVKLKAEGVKSGVHDIIILVPRGGFHGMTIEMKKPGKLKNTSDTQDEFAEFVTTQGYKTAVCDHYLDAWAAITEYMCSED